LKLELGELGGVGAVFWVYKYWEPISAFFAGLFNEIAGYFAPIIDTAKAAWGDLVSIVEPLSPFLKTALLVGFAPLIAVGWTLLQIFKWVMWTIAKCVQLGVWLLRVVMLPFKHVINTINALWQVFTGNLTGALNSLKTMANDVLDILPDWHKDSLGIRRFVVEDKTQKRGANDAKSTADAGLRATGSLAPTRALPALVPAESMPSYSPAFLPPPRANAPARMAPFAPSAPARANAGTVTQHNEIHIHATPSQSPRNIADEVMRVVEQRGREILSGSLLDLSATA
jgi:hypothetical protein